MLNVLNTRLFEITIINISTKIIIRDNYSLPSKQLEIPCDGFSCAGLLEFAPRVGTSITTKYSIIYNERQGPYVELRICHPSAIWRSLICCIPILMLFYSDFHEIKL